MAVLVPMGGVCQWDCGIGQDVSTGKCGCVVEDHFQYCSVGALSSFVCRCE